MTITADVFDKIAIALLAVTLAVTLVLFYRCHKTTRRELRRLAHVQEQYRLERLR